MRVLLLGLDGAGKTTILYSLMGKPAATVPTIGFNVETVKFDPLEFVVWDVSGQDKLRTFWRHYYRGTSGIIFVVDSNDQERLSTVRQELHGILKEEELENAVLLILANKIDLPMSVGPEALAKALALDELPTSRVWHIQRAQANKGTGLKEGLQWLAKTMKPIGDTSKPKSAGAAGEKKQQQSGEHQGEHKGEVKSDASAGAGAGAGAGSAGAAAPAAAAAAPLAVAAAPAGTVVSVEVATSVAPAAVAAQ